MTAYTVQLTFTVKAEAREDACAIAANAYDHLYDTCNDDERLSVLYGVEVLP